MMIIPNIKNIHDQERAKDELPQSASGRTIMTTEPKFVPNDAVEITSLGHFEPSRVSSTDCPGWEKVSAAVAENWPGCIVSPYLMVQCSDSRHYRDLSNHVYRFSAMDLTSEERATIHGNNEKIRLETLHRSVEFFIRLMKKC